MTSERKINIKRKMDKAHLRVTIRKQLTMQSQLTCQLLHQTIVRTIEHDVGPKPPAQRGQDAQKKEGWALLGEGRHTNTTCRISPKVADCGEADAHHRKEEPRTSRSVLERTLRTPCEPREASPKINRRERCQSPTVTCDSLVFVNTN